METAAPKPPADTPGGRLMRGYGSIDVAVASSSDDDEDDDDDDAAMLAEAQREADEAEDMLRQAEEEVRLAELEAAMWEEELASLGGGGGAARRAAGSAAGPGARDAEAAALSSVAEAYREALEASNDDASALREQVIGLEVELADTIARMERASEDRERIGAEYAYLARNYNDLKRKSSSEGGATSSSSSSAASAASAAAEEKVVALTGEIESYMSRIADAETRLAGLETSLAEARSDAGRWRTMHDDASDRASRAAAARDVEHAEEMRAAGEYHELRISEARASLEEARARMMSENDASADVLRAEFDRSLEENSKMISALRAALRKTRRESRTTTKTTDAGGGGIGGESSSSSSSSSSDDLDDVRTKMTEEVANLRSVLKSVQGEMDEKEREVLRAMEGRGETEKLMEEVR